MRKIILIFLSVLIFFLTVFFIANKDTTRRVGINFEILEYKIPIYLKILNFYNRHYSYKYLVKNINRDADNDQDIVLNTAKWIIKNIKTIPEGMDIVDDHPLTIIERRLGANDQFSDLLSVLLVYSDIDSFYNKFDTQQHALTFFKIDDYWSVIDPFFGIFFTNDEDLFASIEDIQKGKWEILNLKLEKINKSNFNNTFKNRFNDYEEIKKFYNKMFYYIPSSIEIDKTTIFNRGGRSYIQKPFGRLKFEIYKNIL